MVFLSHHYIQQLAGNIDFFNDGLTLQVSLDFIACHRYFFSFIFADRGGTTRVTSSSLASDSSHSGQL